MKLNELKQKYLGLSFNMQMVIPTAIATVAIFLMVQFTILVVAHTKALTASYGIPDVVVILASMFFIISIYMAIIYSIYKRLKPKERKKPTINIENVKVKVADDI